MSITKSKLKLFAAVLAVFLLWNSAYSSTQSAFQRSIDSQSSRIAQLEKV